MTNDWSTTKRFFVGVGATIVSYLGIIATAYVPSDLAAGLLMMVPGFALLVFGIISTIGGMVWVGRAIEGFIEKLVRPEGV